MKRHNNKFPDILTIDKSNMCEFIDKYMFICIVLDELIFRKHFENETRVSYAFLLHRIKKKMTISMKNRPMLLFEMWIVDMRIMKLVKTTHLIEDGKDIIMIEITEKGEMAYQEQIYHQIYANLLSAKQSRILSIIAIMVSLAAALVTCF
jgi:hypothetical protein